ncbi:calcium dependent mitochondrial carrier protein [Grosmannia clavigera kw1407]|uniref:Mitochondrial thiamine pyrophosphate carrier 1 n=1 Tax=Grosmannia clavigera (strain kw1407 / UAMH 11150) TaxID=655863 RepID=F0XV23_GROCL|nr:calcium dependent mitochondrial carrier protein [Grosmannia clavigera kw1407]EFW99036.1 calcium dependent mitochondrial carrier protein [Grosmannia clavigera kw1407]
MTARDDEEAFPPSRTTAVTASGAMTTAAASDAEDASERARHDVDALWRRLDPQGKDLDFKGLKKGLRRIDHPMKNADDMLRQIIKLVDADGDGKIQYEEFRVFVETAEHELLTLFRSIDRDHDGRVNRTELRSAFLKTGLSVPVKRLNGFFDEMDANHDGYISFEEWRNFLLFIPTRGDSTLATAFSYYAATVVLNAEGDSLVSDETLEGLGTAGSLFYALFGSLLKLAHPSAAEPKAVSSRTRESELDCGESAEAHTLTSQLASLPAPSPALPPSPRRSFAPPPSMEDDGDNPGGYEINSLDDLEDGEVDDDKLQKTQQGRAKMSKLTQYMPHPGYFVAGALAGGISRTATAPFDRLKVFLLVSTRAGSNASINAVRHGHPLAALHNAARPITDAVVSLYRAGGLRTFFAGNGLNVVKIMPETAIKFGSYEAAKRACASLEGHGDPAHINPYSKFVAGGVAGMIAQFCVYPLDTLKFRLQCETVAGGPTGRALLIQTARRMLDANSPTNGGSGRRGGWRAAYRGVTMGLIGMFPYSAIDMGTFELLKGAVVRYKARRDGLHEDDVAPGNVVTGIIGATSGAFGASVVYPLNVLRTRLQTQGTALHPPTYTGIWDVASRTIANEGWRGLYKGLTPNLLKVAPALSITWMVYENSKTLLGLP